MRYGYKQYCKDYENIENYDKAKADNFVGWDCHHRLETHTPDGKRRDVDVSHKELKALGMYYHRPAEELIFLTRREHNAFNKGKKHTEETKKKIGAASKGNKNALGYRHTDEAKNKIAEAMKGENNPFYGRHHTEESKRKNAEAHKGKHLGKDNPFYGKTHSEEVKKRISEKNKVKMKGMRFFNNGKINIRAKECPDGFVPGRIKKALSNK